MDENEKTKWDTAGILKFFIDIGIAAQEMKEPMTLEEALDIVDPSVKVKPPEERNRAMGREIKAKTMVVLYARKKLADEQGQTERSKKP